MPLDGGQLDTKVTIKSRTVTVNALGDAIETFVQLNQKWAKVVYMRGQELLDAQARVANVDVKFVVRWDTTMVDADATCTVTIDSSGQVYDIKEVLPSPGGRPERADILATKRSD